MKAAAVLGVLLALVIAAALLWVGGEMRFRNCIEGARVAELARPSEPKSLLAERIEGKAELAADLRDCSRLPF